MWSWGLSALGDPPTLGHMAGRKGQVGASMFLIHTRKRKRRAKNPVAQDQDEYVRTIRKRSNYSPEFQAWLDARGTE